MRSRLPCNVMPLHLVDEAKPRQFERFDLRNLLFRKLALNGHKHLRGREPFVKRITVYVKKAREFVRRGVGVCDFSRRGVERFRLDRAGKLVAVSVIDYAAHGGEFYFSLLLAFGSRAKPCVIADLT